MLLYQVKKIRGNQSFQFRISNTVLLGLANNTQSFNSKMQSFLEITLHITSLKSTQRTQVSLDDEKQTNKIKYKPRKGNLHKGYTCTEAMRSTEKISLVYLKSLNADMSALDSRPSWMHANPDTTVHFSPRCIYSEPSEDHHLDFCI